MQTAAAGERMSNTFAREFDAAAFDAFRDAGIADFAQYTSPGGGAATLRRVIVNNARQMYGQDGIVTGPRTTVGIFLGDGAVAKGGTLVIGTVDAAGAFVASGETYRLQQLDETDPSDGSTQYWVVTHG